MVKAFTVIRPQFTLGRVYAVERDRTDHPTVCDIVNGFVFSNRTKRGRYLARQSFRYWSRRRRQDRQFETPVAYCGRVLVRFDGGYFLSERVPDPNRTVWIPPKSGSTLFS